MLVYLLTSHNIRSHSYPIVRSLNAYSRIFDHHFFTIFSNRKQGFGCQEDMIFCGIFDGHGPWGHFVAKQVRNSMPISLLCNWQETQSQTTLAELETDLDESDKKLQRFAIWKHLYLKTCADVDQELEHHRKIDSFNSGTTALTVVRQVKRPSRILPHE